MTGLCPTADIHDYWSSYREALRILRARQEAASTPARRLINDHTSSQCQSADGLTQSALRSHVGADIVGNLPSEPSITSMGGADDSLPPVLFTTDSVDSVGRIASRPGSCASHEAASASSPYGLPSLAREIV